MSVSSIFMGSEISTRIHLCHLVDMTAFFFKALIGTYGPVWCQKTRMLSFEGFLCR